MSVRKFDEIMWHASYTTLLSAAILLIFFISRNSDRIAQYNNVYSRYTACVLSVEDRTEEVIGGCWDHVIEEAGRDVHRYDQIEDRHYWLTEEK